MFQPEIIAQKEIISQTDRAAVLDSIAGGCCIISCEEERILYVNASVLFSYTCPDQESFLRMTGGSFRGMVEAEDYRPLQDFFGVGRRIRTERKKETAAGRYSAPAEQNDPAQKSSTLTDRNSGTGGDSTPVSEKIQEEKSGASAEDAEDRDRLSWNAEGYRYFTFRFRTLEGQQRRAQAFLWRDSLPSAGEVWVMNLIPTALMQQGRMQERFTGLMGVHDFYEKMLEQAAQDRREGHFGSRVEVSFNIVNFKEYNRMFGVQAGDECIWIVADTLRRAFPGQLLAHISADRFCAAVDKEDVCARIEAVCSRVNGYIRNQGIVLKAGICDPGADASDEEVRQAVDRAKIACDSIRDDANRCWAVYTPDMGEMIEWNTYILQHFEEALEKQYIKVYFQPIVRTLTGRLCGLEALARWEDPEKGMIMPGIFVPVLERSRLISRLDTYVLHQVCGMMHLRMEKGQEPIPVSINLALDDFVQTDICGLAEQETAANDLPRECLRFEITESTLAGNSSAVREGVKRLQCAGYQVWLDDFGSQYSSLNSLHDFEFDEIKLDMNFFRNFNEQSRKILTGISDMAKALGIHTVAEGVETPEQVAFLNKIGCGKIQGYYYGRPVSCGEAEAKQEQDRLVLEDERENQMYDATDLIRVAGAMPVGLVHICGQTMNLLFANDAFLSALGLSGPDGLQQARGDIEADWHPMHGKWLSFFAKVYSSSRDEHMTYVDSGQYLRMEARRLSGEQDDWLAVVHLYNVTEDRPGVAAGYDHVLREMARLCDSVFYFEPEKDRVTVLEATDPKAHAGQVFTNIRDMERKYAARVIHERDQERFLWISDPDHLREKAQRLHRSALDDVFRVKGTDGNYYWMIFHMLLLQKAESGNYLVSVRSDIWEGRKDEPELFAEFVSSIGILPDGTAGLPRPAAEEALLEAILGHSDLRLFWKDREMRYLGASRAFLEYFGLRSGAELKGRTDEEMGWHIHADHYHLREQEALAHGTLVRNAQGQCLIGRVPRRFSVTMFPVYQKNEIHGIAGYLSDPGDEEIRRRSGLENREAGVLSFRGMLMAGQKFEDEYRHLGRDFAAVCVDVPDYGRIRRTFGPEIASELVRAVRNAIYDCRDVLPAAEGGAKNLTVSRVGDCSFVAFFTVRKIQDAALFTDGMKKAVGEIQRIGGYRCTLRPAVTWALGSEAGRLDGVLALLVRRMAGAPEEAAFLSAENGMRDDRSRTVAGLHPDISAQESGEKSDALRREETVSGLMEAAVKEPDAEEGIRMALDGIRNLLQADCVLILEELDRDVLHCTYERTKAGIPARMPLLQKIDSRTLAGLKEQQREDGCIVIPDLNRYRQQHPEMTDEDTRSLTACALETEGLSAGWLAVINGRDAAQEENVRVIREMSGFLSGLLQSRDRISHLKDLCLRDQLTGVLNRYGYEQYVIRLTGAMEPGTEDQSVALIFGDINGLKETNDTGGHRAGDDLIRRAAETLVQFSDRDHVFRMGGDEFVLIAENCGNAGAEKLIGEIQQENARKGVSMSLGYGVQKRNELESDTLILSAESRMYNRKSEYHRAARAQMHSS